jgi:glutathione S-transferase
VKLIGNYFSAYTRRVAVSLNAVGLPFELEEVSVAAEPERVRPHNPVVRIPVLLLDNGEALVESYAILDAIDQLAGPARALTPSSGQERRRVMQLTAIALASMEKAQWAFYERRFRPEEKVHQPWIDHNESQVLSGLRYLDAIASNGSGWLACTPNLTQADITTTVICSSIDVFRPHLNLRQEVPHLFQHACRCEELAIFSKSPLQKTPPAAQRSAVST